MLIFGRQLNHRYWYDFFEQEYAERFVENFYRIQFDKER